MATPTISVLNATGGPFTVFTLEAVTSPAGTPSSNVLTTQAATTTLVTVTAASGANETNIKASSAILKSAHFYNNASSTEFVKIYNLSSAPTAGTSTPLFNIAVSPGSVRDVVFSGAISSVGLGYTITAGVTSTSTAGVSADDITGTIEYM